KVARAGPSVGRGWGRLVRRRRLAGAGEKPKCEARRHEHNREHDQKLRPEAGAALLAILPPGGGARLAGGGAVCPATAPGTFVRHGGRVARGGRRTGRAPTVRRPAAAAAGRSFWRSVRAGADGSHWPDFEEER